MPRGPSRRAFVRSILAVAALPRPVRAQSAAERLVAAIQDGGKILYLRYLPADRTQTARDLGRALYALRVPLNDIVTGSHGQARETADAAFGAERVRVDAALDAEEGARARIEELRQLLRTVPGPGMNRVLVGDRGPLELAAERPFPETTLPPGAAAVFVAGDTPQLLGTMTAERVIRSAVSRGALRAR